MTGCKGYDLRGSGAMTEIERTKEADTPGEIPGRSGLQADRRTGNKFIMRGVWLRSKEMEEIIMTLSMKEKKILYAYGCGYRLLRSHRLHRSGNAAYRPPHHRNGESSPSVARHDADGCIHCPSLQSLLHPSVGRWHHPAECRHPAIRRPRHHLCFDEEEIGKKSEFCLVFCWAQLYR